MSDEKCPMCGKKVTKYVGNCIYCCTSQDKETYYYHDTCGRKWRKVLITEPTYRYEEIV